MFIYLALDALDLNDPKAKEVFELLDAAEEMRRLPFTFMNLETAHEMLLEDERFDDAERLEDEIERQALHIVAGGKYHPEARARRFEQEAAKIVAELLPN